MAFDSEVTIYAPYDSSVTAVVLEESLPVWEANGWTTSAPAPEPAPEPASSPAPSKASVTGSGSSTTS